MILDKTKIPLVSKNNDFIYVDTLSRSFYRVFTADSVSNPYKLKVFLCVLGASLVKWFDNLYRPISGFFFNSSLQLIIMILIFLISKKQLGEWAKLVRYDLLALQENEIASVYQEARKSLRSNRILFVSICLIFLVLTLGFLILSSLIFFIPALLLWYVICLLYPTLHLKERYIYLKSRDME